MPIGASRIGAVVSDKVTVPHSLLNKPVSVAPGHGDRGIVIPLDEILRLFQPKGITGVRITYRLTNQLNYGNLVIMFSKTIHAQSHDIFRWLCDSRSSIHSRQNEGLKITANLIGELARAEHGESIGMIDFELDHCSLTFSFGAVASFS